MNASPLRGRTIALPETRELELLAQMLEQRGATTLRYPLVTIHDAPDPAPIEAWLHRLTAGEFDEVIFLTGEGVRRLHSFAERAGLAQAMVDALAEVRTVTRGPKPIKALRDLGLPADLPSETPTTEGIIATLSRLSREDLRGHTVGVQLYGTDPNDKLMSFLREAGAEPVPVAPYRYAPSSDAEKVVELIEKLAAGEIDVITFTNSSQVRRLTKVAQERSLEAALHAGLARTKVASVGPIVSDSLRELGARIDFEPERTYFLKPLVNELVAALGR